MPLAPFRPRLLKDLQGYDRGRFWSDMGAGLTVGVVALPLAMAFAIASGLKPEAGVFTAVIAGFLISALGGSSVQIGGPAGAFIVVVYGIVERYGVANLLLSTVMAGGLLFLLGLFRLGVLVRYIPISIVIGFTNGIAVLIALSQMKDLLGLSAQHMPADFFGQISVLLAHADQINPVAFGLGSCTVLILWIWPRLFGAGPVSSSLIQGAHRFRFVSRIPAPMVVLVLFTAGASWLSLPVSTIGSQFGGIPQALPHFAWPDFSWDGARHLFIPTLTIALLGAIESLLCARVADNLTDFARHDPNQELMAQGVANMVTPFFGGIPATGTIARTVTNVRAGASSPVAGMIHALSLLLVVWGAAPLAAHIPLPVLSGILMFVAWNMGEWREFVKLRHFNFTYRTILLGTFFLTVVFDLTVAVEVGLVLACVFFIYRMSTLFRIEPVSSPAPHMAVFRLYGVLFFGAVGKVEELVDGLAEGTRVVALETHLLIAIDTSGLEALLQLQRVLSRKGVHLLLCGLNEQPKGLIQRAAQGGDTLLDANMVDDLPAAITRAHQLMA